MPFDLSISPTVLLAMWAGGIALAVAFVALWRVVGAGFMWTAAATIVLAGIGSIASGPGAQIALAATAVAAAVARRPAYAAVAFGVAGVGFLAHAIAQSALNPVLALSGALALGGTTSEMLLGHWYLVDPKLPRWALRRLDGAGIVGLIADAIAVIALGALAGAGVLGWVLIGLALMSILMMLGVWFSLKETGYEGVMAATGLSYLSVLTALGAVALGRFLIG
jgi:hypothetical protein